MANKSLGAAKSAKNDEFYTQFSDIQKEIDAYLEFDPDVFRGKVVYCNCDDPFESNFFKYFVLKFNDLGIKKLITTSYKPSPIAGSEVQLSLNFQEVEILNVNGIKEAGRPKENANRFIITEIGDYNDDGQFNLEDTASQLKENKNNEWAQLKGDSQYPAGDFRSDECIELLKQSDIVVTNPPFSLFREYVAQLMDHNKKFLIIGNMNAITYREIFPLLKENKMWLGVTRQGTGSMWFQVGLNMPKKTGQRVDENGVRYQTIGNSAWFTNLDHGRRHQELSLMKTDDVIKFGTKKPFDKYDNYDAIEVSLVKHIPSDYSGVMGVPITFLGKYNPDQFEIVWLAAGNSYANMPPDLLEYVKFVPYVPGAEGAGQGVGVVNKKKVYARVLIKKRKGIK